MNVLISIGQIIVDILFVSVFILGLIACVKLAKLDVTGTKIANKDKLSKQDDDVKIKVTIECRNCPKNNVGPS